MRTRIRIEPARMTDRQLWGWLLAALDRLDPLSQSYVPGQAHNVSLQAQDALLELRLRGSQLSLFETKVDETAQHR